MGGKSSGVLENLSGSFLRRLKTASVEIDIGVSGKIKGRLKVVKTLLVIEEFVNTVEKCSDKRFDFSMGVLASTPSFSRDVTVSDPFSRLLTYRKNDLLFLKFTEASVKRRNRVVAFWPGTRYVGRAKEEFEETLCG